MIAIIFNKKFEDFIIVVIVANCFIMTIEPLDPCEGAEDLELCEASPNFWATAENIF
jgi:hypothetical protein